MDRLKASGASILQETQSLPLVSRPLLGGLALAYTPMELYGNGHRGEKGGVGGGVGGGGNAKNKFLPLGITKKQNKKKTTNVSQFVCWSYFSTGHSGKA